MSKDKYSEFSALEKEQLKLYKRFLRLCCERDYYNRPQAAHRLNVSVNDLDEEYLIKYRVKLACRGNQFFIPKVEIDRIIEEDLNQGYVHREVIRRREEKR